MLKYGDSHSAKYKMAGNFYKSVILRKEQFNKIL